jgi:hypothetical protein
VRCQVKRSRNPRPKDYEDAALGVIAGKCLRRAALIREVPEDNGASER